VKARRGLLAIATWVLWPLFFAIGDFLSSGACVEGCRLFRGGIVDVILLLLPPVLVTVWWWRGHIKRGT